ncbi:hyalin-like isoform X2 [Apostichopus japonicus]|uniref:hyalin-like isoform X2 n=1 Tax=Stichopus japonicus TaxID=307972 RepID=UPI003AB12AE5
MATPASRVSVMAVFLTVIVLLEISSTYAQQVFTTASCSSLGAVNGFTSQPNTNSPYVIQIAPQYYTTGTIITVTVYANQPAGRMLRELICQARDTATNSPVGTFTSVNGNPLLPTNDYNVYNCGSQTATTVRTTNNNIKSTPVVLTYQAAAPAPGNIGFRCSFLQDTGILYQGLASQQVVDQSTVAGPVINNCPGDIFLPLSQASMTALPFVFVEWMAPTSIGVGGANNPVNPYTFTTLGSAAREMTYTFTSGGITATCSFNVVVNDDETTENTAPVLSGCPVGTVNRFTTSPTCNDADQGTLAVNCNPPAGGTFQAGTTTPVECVCTDNLGSSDVCTFNVFVATANTAPVIAGCPVGTVNSFTASPTCNDAEEGALAVNCNPPAGSTFQAGTTTAVTCFCADNLGSSDFCTFSVLVATANTAPVLSGCPDGTVNSFATPPTCNDAEEGVLAVNCNPPAGSIFQAGTTTAVTCSCSDNLGSSDVCTFRSLVT